jgi:hypothetical protein
MADPRGGAVRAFWLAGAAVLFAAPAWSDCPDSSPWGEHLALELIEVTVGGEPLEDLAAYDGYTVSITNYLDGKTSETECLELWADRHVTSGDREQEETLLEYYAVETTETVD